MKIFNENIYGLNESIIASAYPKSIIEPKYDIERAKKLATCKNSSGHDCFLKGIIVQCDIQAPSYWWPQFQRYHFADIISSQSKMHSILKFDIDKQCNKLVSNIIKDYFKNLIKWYNTDIVYPMTFNDIIINTKEEHFQCILSNCPMGLNLIARITTNYLQLKTIYFQRKTHRLPEWHIFIDWIKTLPLANELILIEW